MTKMAVTVIEDYLCGLFEERRMALETLRDLVHRVVRAAERTLR